MPQKALYKNGVMVFLELRLLCKKHNSGITSSNPAIRNKFTELSLSKTAAFNTHLLICDHCHGYWWVWLLAKSLWQASLQLIRRLVFHFMRCQSQLCRGKKLLKTLLAIYHLVEKVIIVKAIIVLQHLALDLWCIHPGNKILHASCHQKCRVCHCIWTHSNIWCHWQSSSQVFSQDTIKS